MNKHLLLLLLGFGSSGLVGDDSYNHLKIAPKELTIN